MVPGDVLRQGVELCDGADGIKPGACASIFLPCLSPDLDVYFDFFSLLVKGVR